MTGHFDVIVVDFPDPTNFAIGKLYTTSFYERVDEHPRRRRLCGGADHLAAARAAQLLDGGRDDRGRRGESPRPTTCMCRASANGASSSPAGGPGHAERAARRPALPHDVAGCPLLFHFPARHGARGGAAQPPVNQRLVHLFEENGGKGAPVSLRLTRRGGAGAGWAGLVGCTREGEAAGRRNGSAPAHERGHRLRDRRAAAGTPAVTQRASVIVVGAGIAGSGAARGSCAPASPTCACSSSKTWPAATAAAIRSPAWAARWRALPARAGPARARWRNCSTNWACAASSRAAWSTTSATCATARRSASSSKGSGSKACCRRSTLPAAERENPRWRSTAASRAKCSAGWMPMPSACRRRVRLACRAGGAGCAALRRLAGARRPGRAGAALVPRLLLPRRLRRRQRAGVGLGRLHHFASRHGFTHRARARPSARAC